MRISFIIPVYKVEQYLRQCVESITHQSYRDIEIILVDDGSPDGSPALCDNMAMEDNRIRVIHKLNGGLSDARNAGLSIATGDYVAFVDGDDFWIESHFLLELTNFVNEHPNLDFVGFNCKYYYPEGERFSKWQDFPSTIGVPVDKNTALCQLAQAGIFPVSACMKFIKRNFLINNNLNFVVGQYSEDIPWFINLIEASKECAFLNHYIYAYRQVINGSSITHNIGIKNINCLTQIIKNEVCQLKNRTFSEEAKNAILSFLAYELIQVYICTSVLDKADAKIVCEQLKDYNWLLSYTQNPKVRKVAIMRNVLGLSLTIKCLRFYLRIRS